MTNKNNDEVSENNKIKKEPEATGRNIMVNNKIDKFMEESRIINKGMPTQILRGRSDIYNEILGLGIGMYQLKKELGEHEFERVWQLLNKLDLKKVNLEKIL